MNLLRDSTMYHITGTKFYRLGSRKFFGYGGNHQNKNKNMRAIYTGDGYNSLIRAKYVHYLEHHDLSIFTEQERQETRILVQRDQAGAEALIVAYLAESGNLRKMFLNGIKPHVYMGCMFPQTWVKDYPQIDHIRMLPLEKVKQAEGWKELAKGISDSDNNQPPKIRYYYVYKQTVHSRNYKIGVNAYMLNVLEKSEGQVVLTKQQASDFINAYDLMCPEIADWWRWVESQIRPDKTCTIYNLLGYPIEFTQEIRDGDYKDLYSAAPQSTVGCITHIAYTALQNYIEEHEKKWDLLNNNHDSYLCQCPLGEEQELNMKMKEYLEQDLISPRGEAFKMRSEGQWGFNWSPAKHPSEGADIQDLQVINKYNLDGLKEAA